MFLFAELAFGRRLRVVYAMLHIGSCCYPGQRFRVNEHQHGQTLRGLIRRPDVGRQEIVALLPAFSHERRDVDLGKLTHELRSRRAWAACITTAFPASVICGKSKTELTNRRSSIRNPKKCGNTVLICTDKQTTSYSNDWLYHSLS